VFTRDIFIAEKSIGTVHGLRDIGAEFGGVEVRYSGRDGGVYNGGLLCHDVVAEHADHRGEASEKLEYWVMGLKSGRVKGLRLPLKELGSRKLPITISIPCCDISVNLSTFDASARIAMRANFNFWFKNS
jgi:hypothetical protein